MSVYPFDKTEIEIYFDYQYFGFEMEEIELVFHDPSKVVDSVRGYEMINRSISLPLHGREMYNDPLHLHYAGRITFWLTLIPLAIGLFVSIFGFSLGIPFDFITTI